MIDNTCNGFWDVNILADSKTKKDIELWKHLIEIVNFSKKSVAYVFLV